MAKTRRPRSSGYLVWLLDVTDRERYRRQLEAKTQQLEVLNRMLRHDIRNDMAVIRGWAETLESHIDSNGQEALDRILRKSDHVIELTEIGRDFAESLTEDTKPELYPKDVRAVLLSEVAAARESFAGADFRITGELPPVTVQANELLGSVFRNLLNNAVHHNDEPTPTITIGADVDEEIVEIQIADNGPGIPTNVRERLFQKGAKGVESSGTGIGLYLIHTLVHQYHGDIWVDDNQPKGTVFRIELPLAPDTA